MSGDTGQDLGVLQKKWLDAVAATATVDALEQVRVDALGKKGEISGLMKVLGTLGPDERKAFGARLNVLRDEVAAAIDAKKTGLADAALNERLARETLDLTLPARPEYEGRIHPITQTIDEIIAIFGEMGFAVAEGPDIEDDFHNFTALNIPADHPARQMQDTFYLPQRDDGSQMVLRTHTSPVQIRALRAARDNLPLAVIAPGRVYRMDSDATHTPMFHQVEGLLVDEGVSFANLKAILHGFMEAFFERNLSMRLRPSYFPFTEPSAEVDITCVACGGSGCRLCKHTGWIEVLGCGMVHPNVLTACEVDSERYTAYAFGMGIDRLAMLRYGVTDLRLFFENDLRFLRQFRGGWS